MVDEYELVSHDEIELLRGELKKLREQAQGFTPPTPLPEPPKEEQEITASPNLTPESLTSLNESLSRLNVALERLFLLFDRTQRDVASQGTPDDKFSRVYAQNEKIAAGLIGMNNMIRDQQIQLNQLNLLFKSMQGRLEEIRFQRRNTVQFKIPPGMNQEEKTTSPLPPPQQFHQGPIEIEIGKPHGQEILEEERTETYPTMSMFGPDLPPPPTSAASSGINVEIAKKVPDDIPPPPKKNILTRFMKK